MKIIHGVKVFDRIKEILNPDHCALLVIDMQNDFCASDGHYARYGKDVRPILRIVPALRELINQARYHAVSVIFVQTTTLPDGASDSPAWLYFKMRDGKSPDYCLPGTYGHRQVAGLELKEADGLVFKHRSSSFADTNLNSLLRELEVQTLIIGGTATEGCVDTTARDAVVRDFYVAIAEDCIASSNPALHRASLTIMKSRYHVLPSSGIVQIWKDMTKESVGSGLR